jgi:hypothetical protein
VFFLAKTLLGKGHLTAELFELEAMLIVLSPALIIMAFLEFFEFLLLVLLHLYYLLSGLV